MVTMLTVLQGRCALIIVMRFQATRSCAACRLDDRAHAAASGSASIMLSMAAVRLAAIDARQSAGRPNGGFAGGSPRWALRNGTAATNCETVCCGWAGFPRAHRPGYRRRQCRWAFEIARHTAQTREASASCVKCGGLDRCWLTTGAARNTLRTESHCLDIISCVKRWLNAAVLR